MSAFEVVSSSAFAIHTDHSENNGDPGFKKAKMETEQDRIPTRRTALGNITNNTRVQPLRATKQATVSESNFAQDENLQRKAAKTFSVPGSNLQSQAFSIHVDTLEQRLPQPLSQLNPVLTSLRPALVDISRQSPRCEGSPMLLDTSVDVHRTIEETAEQRFERILTVPEYSDEIYAYLREAELKFRPKVGYMKKQPDINNSMRCILVDWLVEVAEEYRLHRETLCLAVNYIDRFLSQMSVLRGKLQLVGAACIFLASKYEEIYPPEVGEFVYITDNTYTQKQVLKMEHLVLKVLSFDVAIPTINIFCERFLKHLGQTENDQVHSLSMYLVELSLVDAETFMRFVPSQVAATAVCLANHTLGHEPWSQDMVRLTGYTYETMLECTQALYATFIRAPLHPQQAIQEKYKQSKYKEVASLTPPSTLPYQDLLMMSVGQSTS